MLEINGEAVTGKTNNAISVMMKDIEESNGSIELLVRRENQTTSKARHEKTKSSHRKPHTLRERFSSWYQSLRSSKVHVPVLVRLLHATKNVRLFFAVYIYAGTKS